MNLHGNVVGNPVPRPDWAQTSSSAPDYIKNKPDVDGLLPKSGGTMTGAINMGSKKITNLATPTNNADATTKRYVDGKVAGARLYGTVSLTTSWTNGAQEIGVEGILATDMPHWGVVYSSSSSTREAEKEAFALVDVLETSAGKFTFRCFGDVPTIALNIQWEVNR